MKLKAPGILVVLVNGSKFWINKEIDLTQEIITLDVDDITELIFKKKGDQVGCMAVAGAKQAGQILEMRLFKHSILFVEKIDLNSFIYKAVLQEKTGLVLHDGQIS